MADTETEICNLSLSDLGAKRLSTTALADNTLLEAILCNLHYVPVRDALLRSYFWRFARARQVLVQDTTDPDFEWDNRFILPKDFLRLKSVFEEVGYSSRNRRHSIEGQRFLTDDATVSIRYIRKVTDVKEFDPLFVQLLVLELDLKLVMPIAGAGTKAIQLKESIKDDIKLLMPRVRAVDEDETDTGGRSDWNLARHGGLGIAGQSERFW